MLSGGTIAKPAKLLVLAVLAALVAVVLQATTRQHPSARAEDGTVRLVGQATAFGSGNTGSPTTPLPAGVASGDELVTLLETYPFVKVTCRSDWTKVLDVVDGSRVRLTACAKVATYGEGNPVIAMDPPTGAAMITLAFSGVEGSEPLRASAEVGLTSPPVLSEASSGLLVLAVASDAWKGIAEAPHNSTLVRTFNNEGNSQVAVATEPIVTPGTTQPAVWRVTPQPEGRLAAAIILPGRPVSTSTGLSLTTSSTASTSSSTGSAGAAATSPPAPICDNAAVLTGPSTRPSGAIQVDPGQDLSSIVQNQPPGTTFWLAPGTHSVGPDEFSQVIPKDDDTFLGAPGAILDGHKVARYAFTQQATGVAIRYLTIQNFGAVGSNNNAGVVNQGAASGWTVEFDTIQGNAGAGVFLGSNGTARYNCLRGNEQYGFSMYLPTQGQLHSVVVDHNEIVDNNTYDWEAKIPGCGCTGGGKIWDAHDVTVTSNWVHNNRSVGLWADTNNYGVVIDGNYINDNDDEGLIYEISYNARITNNTFKRNAIVKGIHFASTNNGFPVGAVYISESGGDNRVNGGQYSTLEISGNVFENNWGGVLLWENANRFCGSPSNTSSSYCTLVNPAANLTSCNDPAVGGSIDVAPYIDDCRWKTQNVLVAGNIFRFDAAAVGNCDTAYCGHNSLLSQWGSYPDWSPYKGTAVQTAITYRQNVHFQANQYVGPWRFTVFDTSNLVSFSTWQGLPYSQDPGSTITG